MTKQTDGHNEAGKTALKILKIVLPLALSAALVLWLFHKIDFHKIAAIVRQGVEWRFIVLMMILTALSFIIRGVRWGIQLRAAGIPRMSATAESVSIFSAYALNLIFPYLGEAWRCVFVARRQNAKLSTVVGTDVGDRASDGIMILLFIILTVWLARPAIERFLDRYNLGREIAAFTSNPWFWIIVAVIIAGLVTADILLRHTHFVSGINTSLLRIWRGFAVLFHMPGTGMYLLLTLGIWICYFLETYVCFFAFPFTRHLTSQPGTALGLIPGLVVFVFGSCSMAVPSNGGLGPWNIAVIFALTLYGVNQSDAAAYSLVCWAFQAIMIMALGVFSAFYIAATRRNGHTSSPAGQPASSV